MEKVKRKSAYKISRGGGGAASKNVEAKGESEDNLTHVVVRPSKLQEKVCDAFYVPSKSIITSNNARRRGMLEI